MAAGIPIVYRKYVGPGTPGPATVPGTVYCTIPDSALVNGHQYLILAGANVATATAGVGDYIECRFRVESSPGIPNVLPPWNLLGGGSSGRYTTPTLSKGTRYFAAKVITWTSGGGDLVLNAYAPLGGAQLSDARFVALDLSTASILGGYSDNNTVYPAVPPLPVAPYNYSSLTFTPDGVSDYLILAVVRFSGTNTAPEQRAVMELQFPTMSDNRLVSRTKLSGVANQSLYLLAASRILAAPAAVPLTIDMYVNAELLGNWTSVQNSRMIALRLSGFPVSGWAQDDTPVTPLTTGWETLPISVSADGGNNPLLVFSRYVADHLAASDNHRFSCQDDGNPYLETPLLGDSICTIGANDRISDLLFDVLPGTSGLVDHDVDVQVDTSGSVSFSEMMQVVVGMGGEAYKEMPSFPRAALSPGEAGLTDPSSVSLSGDDIVLNGVFNRLVVVGTHRLAVDPLYVPTGGVRYTFKGPPDGTTNPRQLGFSRGDKIQLLTCDGGPVGPNAGRVFTIVDPATLDVYETVIFPDDTPYKFVATRRGA